jgi:predicted RNase H-like nuclease (RuvC/YqgF family)
LVGRVSGVLKAMGFHLGQDQQRQVLLLDEEFKRQGAEVKRLEARVLELESQVNPKEREIERLKQRLQELASNATPNPSDVQLSDDEVQIIRLLVKLPRVVLPVAAGHINATQIKAEVLLRKLENKNLLQRVVSLEGPSYYVLTDFGQEYAVEAGLA